MYAENQAYDAAHGMDDGGIDGGATHIAAMQTLKSHGIITGYYWGYTTDALFRALAKGLAIAGTATILSLDSRVSRSHGGKNGDYRISADDFYYLLPNGGEFTVFQEVRQ